jgi:hypothetical protein
MFSELSGSVVDMDAIVVNTLLMTFFSPRCVLIYIVPEGKSKLIIIQTDKISQQSENCENRNDPDLVQSFLKKWWVESD